jgi:prolyl 4-hydroxylase
VIQNRSSEGTWFQRAEDAFIERIDRRLSSLMNWPLENGEGLQVLHYGPGAEYRPHYDYFDPDQAGSAVHTASGGQRVSTLVVYLNDVAGGGETIFPDAGIAIAARRGSALYFRYMNGQRQLDPLTLHGGAPVREGEKWIATRWMREAAHR